jgi:hypothetical protein
LQHLDIARDIDPTWAGVHARSRYAALIRNRSFRNAIGYRSLKMRSIRCETIEQQLACALTHRAFCGVVEELCHPGEYIEVGLLALAAHDLVKGKENKL